MCATATNSFMPVIMRGRKCRIARLWNAIRATPQAVYNLGRVLLAQKKDSAAVSQFQAAARLETNPLRKAKVYHNMGWICQNLKMYDDAIEQYKEALRMNPNDDETRYNLALCKHLQKMNENNKKDNDNNDKKNNDKEQLPSQVWWEYP